MFHRVLELEYDKLIIGSDLSALCYSYVNKIPLLYTRIIKPFKYFHSEYDKQIDVWNKLCFLLSIDKYIPFSDKISNIRLDEKNITFSTKDNLLIKIKFNNLFIFDDYKIDGLPTPVGKTNYFCHVIDYFNIKSGAVHNIDFLVDEDDFVNKVIFYPSNRIPNGFNYNNKKDCLAISKIHINNLLLNDYSQNYARLKTASMMDKAGIKGYYEKADNHYRRIMLESTNREVCELGKNIYSNLPDYISFVTEDYQSILNSEHENDDYVEYIRNIYEITI